VARCQAVLAARVTGPHLHEGYPVRFGRSPKLHEDETRGMVAMGPRVAAAGDRLPNRPYVAWPGNRKGPRLFILARGTSLLVVGRPHRSAIVLLGGSVPPPGTRVARACATPSTIALMQSREPHSAGEELGQQAALCSATTSVAGRLGTLPTGARFQRQC
jgi:hypothetical protein